MSALESFLDGLNERAARLQINAQRINDPKTFYEQNAEELVTVGAEAFGRPVETFALQVEERFNRAEFGHVLLDDNRIVGFGLFDILRGDHWQAHLDRR